ncbi:MAG TPA: hypothetical protein VG125_01605 [Pirellulales bacterium]|nr:hypothetical protein [Pirellulales bacterium]
MYQWIGYSVFFLAAVVGSASAFFLPDPTEHGFKDEQAVVLVGGGGVALFGAMLLLSIYVCAAYYVERFTIKGTRIAIRSLLRNRDFDVSELQSLKWIAYPQGGSIRFQVLGSRARLDLSEYSKADQLEIIRSLHDLVPPDVQVNWPLYCHKVALPLRDGEPSIVRTGPKTQLCTLSRKRYDRMLAIGLPMAVVLAVVLWAWLKMNEVIVLPFVVIGFWLLLRFNVPREGLTTERLTSSSQGSAILIGLGAMVISPLVMISLGLWGIEESTACGVGCAIAGPAFLFMLYLLHKAEKQERTADEQAAPSAVANWQRGEGFSQRPAV